MIHCPAVWCANYANPPKLFCDYHWYLIPFLNRQSLLHNKPNKDDLAATIKWLARKEGHLGGYVPKPLDKRGEGMVK